MARKQYIDLSNSIESWRQKNNITSDYIGDLDELTLSPPHDQTIVKAINNLDSRILDEDETRSLFSVVQTGPTTLSSLVYDSTTGTFYYNTVALQPFHIPNLDASKITTGQFNTDRIPPLDASKVASGVLDLARIPNLPASKITSGQFDPNRIPSLDASKITTGIFDLARIPDIPVTKLTRGPNGETISQDLLGDDVVFKSGSQTITGQKTFTSNILLHASMWTNTDVSHDIGQPSIRFRNMYANAFVGTATQSLYADLAEKYLADIDYEPGTIMSIGGEKEVTASTSETAHSIIGVVSTAPGLIMNSELENGTLIALKGRVPVKVKGKVKKGDRLVLSDIPGTAETNNSSNEYIAISLEDGEGLVEAVIR
jgi:hypothetical protein